MCTEKRGQILTTYWLLRSRYINMRGIWSNSSLSVPSEYGATLGGDFKGDRIRRQNRANRRRQEFQALQGYRACLIGHNSRRAFHNGCVFDLGLERLEADYDINGLGTLVVDGKKTEFKQEDVAKIGAGQMHGIMGLENLQIVEVQLGRELSEDDIIRSDFIW